MNRKLGLSATAGETVVYELWHRPTANLVFTASSRDTLEQLLTRYCVAKRGDSVEDYAIVEERIPNRMGYQEPVGSPLDQLQDRAFSEEPKT